MGDEELRLRLSVAELRAANADFLDHLGGMFGDGRFRAAAALLRGRRAGRPPVDDASAVAYAEKLIRSGIAKSSNSAADMAAKVFSPPHYHSATKDRIRRKLMAKLIKSKD